MCRSSHVALVARCEMLRSLHVGRWLALAAMAHLGRPSDASGAKHGTRSLGPPGPLCVFLFSFPPSSPPAPDPLGPPLNEKSTPLRLTENFTTTHPKPSLTERRLATQSPASPQARARSSSERFATLLLSGLAVKGTHGPRRGGIAAAAGRGAAASPQQRTRRGGIAAAAG